MSATPDVCRTGTAPASPVDAPEYGSAPEPGVAARTSRLAAVSWRHWFREVAVIAAGALAALGAQAWWQDRQDAERERDYLRHLVADTRENVRRVDEAITADSASALAQARVADALYGAGATLPADTLMRLLIGGNGSAFSASNFQPVAGTYTALLATGDLRLIRDETVRARVVAFAARLESEREILRDLWQQAFGDVRRVPLALPYMRLAFTDQGAMRAAAARFPFERLRTDPDMASLLFTLQASTVNRLSHLRGIRDDTRQLLAALQPRYAARVAPLTVHDSAVRPPK